MIGVYSGNLNHARCSHTASLLSNGKVLVVGGYGTCGSIHFAEVYNSTTGEWTIDSRGIQKRYGHTTSILSDSIILVVWWKLSFKLHRKR